MNRDTRGGGVVLSRQGRRPLDEARQRLPVGTPVVIEERCKECRFCIELCPREVLVMSPRLNPKGYHIPEVAEGKGGECIVCRFCEHVCPEFAIYIEEKGA